MAGQLFFKKPLQVAIREGRKSTTIRRWDRAKPGMQAGEVAYAPGVGWLAIEAVEKVDLDLLGEDDARADGFESLAGLRQLLFALYPDHAADGKDWFRVRFRLRTAEAPRRRRRAADDHGGPGLFDPP